MVWRWVGEAAFRHAVEFTTFLVLVTVGSRMPVGFSFEAVSVERDGAPILGGVNCVLSDRGVTVVVGPSGSGKTTLLRLLNRLDVPTSGVVSWRGTPLDGFDPCTLRRRVGMVAQRPVPFEGTVAANLRVGRPDLADDEVVRLLELVGLASSLAAHDAATLSGGEAQRMCIARTLATEPDVILADEPTSSLDEAPRRALEDLARRLAADDARPIGWVWVSHDLAQINRLADEVVVVGGGQVLAVGPLDEVRRDGRDIVRRSIGSA